VSATLRTATVAVVGLGDLGAHVVDAVARLPIGRVVAVGRREERARQVAGQAAIVAGLTAGAQRVEAAVADASDVDAMAAVLRRLHPDVIVTAASRHTWWRTPEAVAALPFGVWLPLLVGLTRDLMRARRASGVAAPVVALPYPDAVGPVLAGIGLAPELGAGNVSEVAAKLQMLAAAAAEASPHEVDVRLIAHHAVERVAFAAFGALAGDVGDDDPGPPPWRATIAVRGRPLRDERVRELLTAAHPLLDGRATHVITAAATAGVVAALLSDMARHVHAPAPGGRPGGYPVTASVSGVALDLPPGMPESEAIAINAAAARWDGIERIDPDGTITFTDAVAEASERMLGTRLERVAVGEIDDVAAELERRLAS
jgi:hypothetical protein